MTTKKIVVYSTPTCYYCTLAKNYFTTRGISYEDKNVGIDRTAVQEMIMRSGQMGVPVIDIGGRIIVGFQQEAIDRLINE